MAYGNILGYTAAPQPGAYNFHQTNGSSVLLSGAPAENLKARLDASAGFGGQRVAGPGGGAPGMPPESVMAGSGALNEPTPPAAAPAMSIAPPQAPAPAMSVAPPPGPAPVETAPVGPRVENATPELAPAPAAPQAHALNVGDINIGLIQGPDGRLYQNTPGVAGVTQQQLQAKALTGVSTPHSMSESVTGGFEPSADYLERRSDLAIDKRLAIDKAADAEAENAVREKQIADQQFAMAAQSKAEEQARTAQITAQVQKDLETKDRLQNELGNAKVNPNRIFSGTGGTWRAIGAALAAGLGTAGSGLQAMGGHPGAPNLAYQAIQSAIDRDISAQENAIKVKGTLADNALTQYMRSGQSLEQAKLGLRSAQLQWVAAQNQQSAALTKGSQIEPNRDMLHNQVLSALNDNNEQYRQLSLGQRAQQVASQVVYPHAGSVGGLRAVTPDKALDLANKTTEVGGKGIENAQKLYNLQHPKAPGAAKQQGALADNQAAQQELIKAAAAAGLSYDEKSGSFVGQAPGIYKEGAGSFHKDYTANLGAAAPLVLKAQGVSRVGTSEQEAWSKQGKTISGESNTKFLQSQLEVLKAKERAIHAGGGGVAEAEPAVAAAEPEPTE